MSTPSSSLDADRGDAPRATSSAPPASITDEAAQIHTLSHYAILRIGRGASVDAIEAAYDALAMKLHPERLSEALRDEADAAYCVFARAFAAIVVLTDVERRKDYDAALAARGGVTTPPSEHSRVFGAESQAERAEAASKAGDARGAERAGAEAVQNDPEMIGYLATLAAAYAARSPALTFDKISERALDVLDACLARDPGFDRACVARARILRRTGRELEAHVAYEKALRINARNADAEREIHGPAPTSKAPPSSKPILSLPPRAIAITSPSRRAFSWVYFVAVVVALGVGIAYVAIKGVPTQRNKVHDLLVRAEIDDTLSTLPAAMKKESAPNDHDAALDALGASAAKLAVEFLVDTDRAAIDDTASDRSMRECASHYLLRLAERLKIPPPKKALAAQAKIRIGVKPIEVEWADVAAEWATWVDAAKASGALR